MFFTWLKSLHRQKFLNEPFPQEWLEIIDANAVQYLELKATEQAKLRDDIRIVVAEKHWEGCDGLVITDEIKVTIAAQACLLLVGMKPGYYYDRVRSVIVYPDAFRRKGGSDGFLVDEEEHWMLGEAWEGGAIVLSWPDVLAGGRNDRDGRNVVLHEFAHHLDGLDGEMGGSPPLDSQEQQQRWYQVTEFEYERLVAAAKQGRITLLDQYGATNKAEFFAVSTECFFEHPVEMRKQHPELYEILQGFYRQDPAKRREAGR